MNLTGMPGYLSKPGEVRLLIYNLSGQRVRTLVEVIKPAGYNEVQWDGRDDGNREVGSDIYLLQLEAGVQQLTKQIILLR